jgi:hypothetical protein
MAVQARAAHLPADCSTHARRLRATAATISAIAFTRRGTRPFPRDGPQPGPEAGGEPLANVLGQLTRHCAVAVEIRVVAGLGYASIPAVADVQPALAGPG